MNKSSLYEVVWCVVALSLVGSPLRAMDKQQGFSGKKLGIFVRCNGDMRPVDYDTAQPIQVFVKAAAKKYNVSSKGLWVVNDLNQEVTGEKDLRWGSLTQVYLTQKPR